MSPMFPKNLSFSVRNFSLRRYTSVVPLKKTTHFAYTHHSKIKSANCGKFKGQQSKLDGVTFIENQLEGQK